MCWLYGHRNWLCQQIQGTGIRPVFLDRTRRHYCFFINSKEKFAPRALAPQPEDDTTLVLARIRPRPITAPPPVPL
jgi:hypothetical protein